MRRRDTRCRCRPGRAGGHTLIELLIVLVLAGVLLGMAAPSFQQSLQRMRLQSAVNDLVAAIDLTRAQAIARGGKVTMAPAGELWHSGWLVFIDSNANRHLDSDETLLYQHAPLHDSINIADKFTSGGTPTYIAYNAAGRTCSATSSLTARWGTLSIKQGQQSRNVKINMLGRVRVCDPATDSGDCSGVAD